MGAVALAGMFVYAEVRFATGYFQGERNGISTGRQMEKSLDNIGNHLMTYPIQTPKQKQLHTLVFSNMEKTWEFPINKYHRPEILRKFKEGFRVWGGEAEERFQDYWNTRDEFFVDDYRDFLEHIPDTDAKEILESGLEITCRIEY